MEPSRLKVGVDVPWVTSWSEEKLVGAKPCPEVEGRLAVVQEEHPGYGRPIYSANHFRRQRESVRRMLCPMCGEPTREDNRWTLTAKLVKVGALRARGLRDALPPQLSDKHVVLDAGAVAPLHRECATRSLQYCPHLKGDETTWLRRFPRRWEVYPLYVETDPRQLRSGGPVLPVPIVTFLQLCGLNPR